MLAFAGVKTSTFSSIFTVIYRYFFYVTFCVFKLNVRFYLLCIHIGNFMHCALYVFYEANKDDYYNTTFLVIQMKAQVIHNIYYYI